MSGQNRIRSEQSQQVVNAALEDSTVMAYLRGYQTGGKYQNYEVMLESLVAQLVKEKKVLTDQAIVDQKLQAAGKTFHTLD